MYRKRTQFKKIFFECLPWSYFKELSIFQKPCSSIYDFDHKFVTLHTKRYWKAYTGCVQICLYLSLYSSEPKHCKTYDKFTILHQLRLA